MSRLLVLLIVLSGVTSLAQAQQSTSDLFFFDVAFWKKQLRISNEQMQQLQIINRQMYSALYEMSSDRCIESSDLILLMELWKSASVGVLTERQKRRWKTIVIRYKGLTSAGQRLSTNGIWSVPQPTPEFHRWPLEPVPVVGVRVIAINLSLDKPPLVFES